MIDFYNYRSTLYNKHPKAIILLDEDNRLAIFKIDPHDNVKVEGVFEDIPEYGPYYTKVNQPNLREVDFTLSYGHHPDTVYVEGELGGLINGLYSE